MSPGVSAGRGSPGAAASTARASRSAAPGSAASRAAARSSAALVSVWEAAATFQTARQSSKPTNTTASSTDLRRETTALAGKLASGQPMATQIMIT